jgi:hypothetical protein
MMWLEMISIRTADAIEASKVYDLCRKSLQSIAHKELSKLTVYCNTRYTSDISIHLEWKADPGWESILGRAVSEVLGDHGLISHTSWIEQEDFTVGKTTAEGIGHGGCKSPP